MKIPTLFKTFVFVVSLLLLPGTLCFRAEGAAGDVDLSFDPGSSVNGAVNTVALQPNGKMLIGGEFTTVRGLARNDIARINPDGSGDAAFKTNLPLEALGPVYALALQPDGKILAGHYNGIVRLHPDGSLDTAFSAEIGEFWEGGTVHSIAMQPDGKAIIGGEFSAVNGTARNGLARLNANGSLDRSFFPGAVLCCANALALQPDGKLLLIGVSNVNGTNRPSVARLNSDGSLDATFLADEEISSPSHMDLQPDGKILVAGYFNSGGYGIARLNGDGRLDGSYHPELPAYEGFAYVASLVVQLDGKLLVSGPFTSVNGTGRNGIARLNADGSLDSGFDPGAGPNSHPLAVAELPNGEVLICGSFTTVSGAIRQSIARLHADGSLDGTFNPGSEMDGRVTSLVVQPDGKVLIGGSFTTVHGFARPGVARLHTDGSLDISFEPAIRFYATASHIRSVALQPDGRVLITGIFDTGNGNNIQDRPIARLHADGSLDSSFQPNLTVFIPADPCPPGYWYCEKYATAETALVQPDGKIIISGAAVTIATGNEALDYFHTPFLTRFRTDGTLDSSFQFGTGISAASLQRMTLQPDGKLLVTGSFTVNGASRGMARLNSDGTLDTTFNPGIGIIGSYVNSTALQSDGKVLIGGMSSWMLRGTVRHEYAIARLNADGTLDGTFNPPTTEHDTVHSLVLQPDGKVLIAGLLHSISSTDYNTVARLNADGGLDPGFHHPIPGSYVMALALQPDGNVLIGGDFMTVDGAARPNVARLFGDSPAPSLDIRLANGMAVLSWPVTAVIYEIHESADLSLPGSWTPVAQPAVTDARQISVTVPTTAPRKFFRLRSW